MSEMETITFGELFSIGDHLVSRRLCAALENRPVVLSLLVSEGLRRPVALGRRRHRRRLFSKRGQATVPQRRRGAMSESIVLHRCNAG